MPYEKLKKASQKILKNNKDILSIILTGSRARGDNEEDSDYDIVFVTRKGKKLELEQKYKKKISEKAKIDGWLLCTHLWPKKEFIKGYQKGNSFVYTTIRDGKLLASRGKNILDLELPNCEEHGKDRLKIGEDMLKSIKLHFKFKKEQNYKKFSGIELEQLGFSVMHLCWSVCLLNNKCPKSKYTVLGECKPYLRKFLGLNKNQFERKFETIQKTYKFYSKREENFDLEVDMKEVKKIYEHLLQIFNLIKANGK